jgi:hypothetical protein
MNTYRFGQKLKLPSTVAIKHQFFVMMLADEIRAIPPGQIFHPENSNALEKLRGLATQQTRSEARLEGACQ